MGTIEALWTEYRGKVVPVGAGPDQVIETRRAFFAGCAAMMSLMTAAADATPNTEAGVEASAQLLDGIAEELQSFQRDVLAGRA